MPMKYLERGDWSIEIEPTAWLEIISFLNRNGWQPGIEIIQMVAPKYEFDDELAMHFAQAGEIVLEEAMKDPMSLYSVIRFDMGKFAEIIEFAQGGGFIIRTTD